MKKALALGMLVAPLMFALPSPAAAGSSTDAALALGAFAVLNQLVLGQTVFQAAVPPRPVVVQQPPVVYGPPPAVYAPPPVAYVPPPPVVVYAPPAPPPVVVTPAPVVAYAPAPVVVRPGGYWVYRGGYRVWVAYPVRRHGRHW